MYKGRLVGNTQKAVEQQHTTGCHKTGSQARLRRGGSKTKQKKKHTQNFERRQKSGGEKKRL